MDIHMYRPKWNSKKVKGRGGDFSVKRAFSHLTIRGWVVNMRFRKPRFPLKSYLRFFTAPLPSYPFVMTTFTYREA